MFIMVAVLSLGSARQRVAGRWLGSITAVLALTFPLYTGSVAFAFFILTASAWSIEVEIFVVLAVRGRQRHLRHDDLNHLFNLLHFLDFLFDYFFHDLFFRFLLGLLCLVCRLWNGIRLFLYD